MTNVRIWYFFEGTDAHASVVIARDEYVEELAKGIFKSWENSLCKDVGYWSLVLLKVRQNILFLFQPAFSDFF
jgi:hypothetical protein